MNQSSMKRLKSELTHGAGLLVPGAANALTARVIASVGFRALEVTGAGISNTHLGVPDMGLITATELIEHVVTIRDAVEIPILVDADTGFGNALNVARTVRALERAGADLVQLEDQTFPKRCGHFEGKSVVPKEEMVQKLKAAVDARHNQDMMILARTDARAVEGINAAIDRAAAYSEAGADVLFIEAPIAKEELAQIPRAVPGVHFCNMVVGGKTPLFNRDVLAGMGYAGIFYANVALQASLLAMKNVLGHLHACGTIAGMEDAVMSFEDRQKVVDIQKFKNLERRYS